MKTTERKPRVSPKLAMLTTTAPLKGERPEGRYRTTWKNTTECTHRWASNTLPEGRSGNVYFRDGTIYSYGGHFPMARWVKLRSGEVVVFFTTQTYSSSTSGHKSDVLRAIPMDVRVIRVWDVMANRRYNHIENLKRFKFEALQAFKKAGKARGRKALLLGEAAGFVRSGNAYAEAVGLRERIADPEDLMVEQAKAEKADAAAEARRVKKARAKHLVDLAEWEQKLAVWHDGGEWPGNQPRWGGEPSYAYLRIKGKVLETSMRAVVPLRVAMPILKIVRSGQAYDGNAAAEPVVLDGYELREICPETRTVTIGCHVVTYDEIERLAQKHKL